MCFSSGVSIASRPGVNILDLVHSIKRKKSSESLSSDVMSQLLSARRMLESLDDLHLQNTMKSAQSPVLGYHPEVTTVHEIESSGTYGTYGSNDSLYDTIDRSETTLERFAITTCRVV